MVIRHLAMYMHDVVRRVTEIWCDAESWGDWDDVAEHIDDATCPTCLREAARYGADASSRLASLGLEPIEQHARRNERLLTVAKAAKAWADALAALEEK